MEYSELLFKRRSVRDYLDKDVPVELLKEIMKRVTTCYKN